MEEWRYTCQAVALDKAPGLSRQRQHLTLLCHPMMFPLPEKPSRCHGQATVARAPLFTHLQNLPDRALRPAFETSRQSLGSSQTSSVTAIRSGQLVSRVDRAQSIAVAECKPRQQPPRVPHATALLSGRSTATPACQGTCCAHSLLSYPEPARAKAPAGASSRRVKPVAAFVVVSQSAPPGPARTPPPLPCSKGRSAPGGVLLAAHSHTTAFQSPG